MNVPFKLPEAIETYAWPGGYPIFYLCADGESLCPSCVAANRKLIEAAPEYLDSQWEVVGSDINWEDSSMYCAHCNARIESAYSEG